MAVGDTWPLVWAELTGTAQIELRRYASDSEDRPRPPCPGGYHDARFAVDVTPVHFDHVDSDRQVLASLDQSSYDGDARWPAACEHDGCDYVFVDEDPWQVNQHEMYVLPDGAEATARELPVGSMYDAWWSPWKGDDGLALAIRVPRDSGYPWLVDSRASSCPREDPHHCWCRHGDPKTEPVTIDKNCDTCPGGGSILVGDGLPPHGFHGVVTAGVLQEV